MVLLAGVPLVLCSLVAFGNASPATPMPKPPAPSPSAPPSSVATCYAVGERCIGARDFPFVPYKPCCGSSTCTGRDPIYGFACKNPTPTNPPPICYSSGQRCIGAPNFPAIPYLPCCDGMTCTATDPRYGLACESPPVNPPIPSPTLNCYTVGERCIGDHGFPAVPYKPCCGDMTCTARDPVYGRACELSAPSPSPSTPLTCYPAGRLCQSAFGFPPVAAQPCCGTLTCTKPIPKAGLACE